MWGTTSRTSSPERVTMRRSTPWVEGCCGPTFRVITSVRSSLASSGGASRGISSRNSSLIL